MEVAEASASGVLAYLVDLVLHMDVHLNELIGTMGPWIYVFLFMIIFCETGLVITPFLPGDSLLFALGALCAVENAYLSYPMLGVLLIVAGILGDATNYAIGRYFGPKVFRSKTSFLFNERHLATAQRFYDKYGGKTIILARFLPIIRTFAPFVAGIGNMSYRRFAVFNVVGAVAWVGMFLSGGYWFGNRPFVKDNFHIVIVAIIVISLLPMVFELIQARRLRKAEGQAAAAPPPAPGQEG
jgi:membrane-associated protein